MFEPLFELMPSKIRVPLERIFHRYEIHSSAGLGRNVKIIYNNKKLKGKFFVGENSFIGIDSIIDLTSDVIIGENVQIAPNVLLLTHDSSKKPVRNAGILIENNAYVGAGTIVLPGTKIGKNSVIGAGAVVTKNVPPNIVVAGVPAQKLKELK